MPEGRTGRFGTQRSPAFRRAVGWVLGLALAGAGGIRAASVVEFIGVTERPAGAEVRILSSGRPEVVGSQLDRDGVLVVELDAHRPRPGLEGLRRARGLVAAVEVRLHDEVGGPATRILIRTRDLVSHAISLEGSLVRVELQRLASPASRDRGDAGRLAEHIQSTQAALAESEQARAALAGKLEVMSQANQRLEELFEELEQRRDRLEQGLGAVHSELARLREERDSRDEESSRRLAELAGREAELEQMVAELTAQLGEAEAEASRLARRLAEAEEGRARSETGVAELESERAALLAELAEARDEVARYRDSGVVRGRATASVNVRAGPGTRHPRVGGLAAQTIVEVLSRGEGWLEVRAGGLEGWVSEEYLALEDDELSAAQARVAELDRELERNRTASDDLSERLAQADAERRLLASELEQARGEASRLSAEGAERTEVLTDRLLAAEGREAELAGQVERLTAEVNESRAGESGLSRRLEQAVDEQARLAERLRAAEASEQDLVRRVEQLTAEVADGRDAEEELAGLESRLERAAAERAALAVEVETLTAERERLSAELATSRQEAERYRVQGLLRGRTTANLNLRAGPGTGFERLTLLPVGTVAEVLRPGEGWIEVRMAGRQGWVSGDYFQLEQDEIAELSGRLSELEASLDQSQSQGEALAGRLGQVEGERDELASELAASRSEAARLESESTARIATLEDRLAAAEGRESDLERRVEQLGAAATAAQAAEGRLEATLRESETERSDLAARLEAMASGRRSLQDQVSSLEQENAALGAELAAADELRGTVAELTAREAELSRAGRELEEQLGAALAEQAELRARLEESRRTEGALGARAEELDGRLAEAEREGRRLVESAARSAAEKARLEARIEEGAGERAALDDRVAELEVERAELTARLERLSGELATTRGALDRLAAAPAPAAASPGEAAGARGPRAAVEAWAAAWSNGNVERYLSFYAREFEPADGSSRSDWESLRRSRLSEPAWIRVGLSDLEVREPGPGRATVSFTQSYESDRFRDRVVKLLELVSEDGRWKIARELVR